MTNCPYEQRISPYYDGELPESAAAEMARHLGQCARCAAELKRLEALSGLLRQGAEPAGQNLMLRLQGRLEAGQRSRMVQRFAEVITALAASILILCGIMWLRASGMAKPVVPPVWESALLEPAGEERTAGDPEEMALWIVQDLSRTNGYE